MRTGGHLAAAERRRLVADLARAQVRSAVGRLSLLAHLNPGRNEAARVPGGRAWLLRRYGAFTAAIALAPFDE